MFPTIDENQSLQQLVIQCKDIYGNDEETIIKESKRALIRVATFQGIIRSKLTQVSDREDWYREYIDQNHHYNMQSLIEYYQGIWMREKCFEKIRGFNLIIYTFSTQFDIELLSKVVSIEEKIVLSSIHKKKQFSLLVENFFSIENNKELLLIFADQLNDSKNIINLCRSKINNQRTKRLLEIEKNPNYADAPAKHVCLIIKLDQTKEDNDYNISFGKDWRQYTVDLLNGKGQSDIDLQDLMNKDLDSLLSIVATQSESKQDVNGGAVSTHNKDQIFEQSLVEAISKIYYKKNRDIIQKRISRIQEIFSSEKNNSFLKKLILMKFSKNEKYEQMKASWKDDIVTNDFLMRSNLTFHSAAIEYLKSELVRHLAFIIFYLEQDGIITAFDNPLLFEMAKGYFNNLFTNNYINQRIQDMYYLTENFDRIKFPLARVIHKQFQQLKIQFMKNDKRQDEKKMIQKSIKMFEREDEFLDLSMIELNQMDRFLSSRHKKQEREQQSRYRLILSKDQHLAKNIVDLDEWCKIYFPKEYIDQNMLTEDNIQYLEDFSYLLNNQDSIKSDTQIVGQTDYIEEYKRYIKTSLTLFLKDRIQNDKQLSKSQIYGIYWKYENLLFNVWKIIKENAKIMSLDKIGSKLDEEMRRSEYFRSPDIKYFPKETFVQSIIKVFYDIYYPTENPQFKMKYWEQSVKQTFQRLNDLSFYYQGVTQTFESRVIIFLLKFHKQIIDYLKPSDAVNVFAEFAHDIRNIFNKPDQIFTYLQGQMDRYWLQNHDIELRYLIYQFAIEYIIDSFQINDTINLNFLLNKVIIFLIDPQGKLNHIQEKDYFKFNLYNLVKMVIKIIENLESNTFQKIVYFDQEKFEQNLNDKKLENIKILHAFLNKVVSQQNGDFIRFSDPFVVALVDMIEDTIILDPFEENDSIAIEQIMEQARQILMNQKLMTPLQIYVAVACFKKITKIYVEEISFYKDGEESSAEEMAQVFRTFFLCDSDLQRTALKPFGIYVMKQIYKKYDFERKDRESILLLNEWFKEFADIQQDQEIIKFSIINQPESKIFKEQLNNITNLTSYNRSTEAPQRFYQILAVIDHYYLSRRDAEVSQTQFEQIKGGGQLFQDPNFKEFIRTFVDHDFVKLSRNKFVRIDGMPNEKFHFKLTWMMIGAAAFANPNTFLSHFYLKPLIIKDNYVPFVQNFQGDSEYHKMFKNNENLSSLKCMKCGQITLRIELSNEKHPKSKFFQHGERKCKNTDTKWSDKACEGTLQDHDQLDMNKLIKNTNELGKPSYIAFDLENYENIKVRNLKNSHLAVGRIILHSVFMLSLAFTQYDNEIMGILLIDYLFSGQTYDTYLQRTLKYLSQCLNKDWEFLRNTYFINDEKVAELIHYVILGIVKNQNSAFNIELLKDLKGREQLEQSFKSLCDQVFNDISKFFEIQIGCRTEMQKYMQEFNQVGANDYYQLLRNTNIINISQFEQHIKDDPKDSNDKKEYSDFFRIIFEQKESLRSIRNLKPLVQWARYIFDKWNTQLTYDEANEMTLIETIQRDFNQNQSSKDYQKRIEKDYKKFKNAWNSFAGLIIRDYQKDKGVEVVIPKINDQSKLILCCLTKDKIDQPGHIFYILLKYLAIKQNNVLDQAEKLFNENNINSIKFPRIQLLNLRKEQIIYFREKQEPKSNRGKLGLSQKEESKEQFVLVNKQDSESNIESSLANMIPNQKEEERKFEEEKFEQIIIKNSACSLKYRQGMQVEYNIQMIKNSTIEDLFKGKHVIDLEEQTQKLNFQYVNLGNLYSQISEIYETIPQQKCSYSRHISSNIKSDYQVYEIYQEFKTALNYLYQCAESPTMNLGIYFQEYRLDKLAQGLNDEYLLQEIQISHLISVYESLEKRLIDLLISNVNERFKVPISQNDQTVIEYILSEEPALIKNFYFCLSRLCIRLLSTSKFHDDSQMSLFDFVLQLQNKQLFGVGKNVDYELWGIIFSQSKVKIENAFAIYDIFKKKYNENENKKQEVIDEKEQSMASLEASDPYVFESDSKSKEEQSSENKNSLYGRNTIFDENLSLITDNHQTIRMSRPSIFSKQNLQKLLGNSIKPSDSDRIFSDFLIISADISTIDIDELTKDNSSQLESKIQYLFTDPSLKKIDQKRQQIKGFCFPCGVFVRIMQDHKLQDYFQNQDINPSKKNTFVFTIPLQEEDGYDLNKYKCLYVLGVIKKELVEYQLGKKRHMLLVEKAYCILSLYNYYDLHMQILGSVFSLFKNERIKLESQFRKQIFSDIDLQKEVAFKMPIITKDIEKLLKNYNEMSSGVQTLKMQMADQNLNLNFDIAQQHRLFQINELNWYGPQLLPMMKARDFMRIVSALLLETSIIFISDNLPTLSAEVIGIQTFLEPFEWCHTSIPVLPQDLLEITGAPTPFIVGILRSQQQLIEWSEITNQCLLVDFKDDMNKVEITESGGNFINPCFHSLVDYLTPYFDQINNRDYSEPLEVEVISKKINRIAIQLKFSLKVFIINLLPIDVLSQKVKLASVEDAKQLIIQKCDQNDREFLQQLVETQMFTYFADGKYTLKQDY
ncbi:UNKNOWN [Stylonychia lemnae]|uniref:UDENN domain-containing protein n=1 Tax=Stylonychia lemnae TaxID=5949 RepID=A0A078AU40_STYLE|nr:UNKNOWN [Stylonychia lemnae]|eukprot:CDW84752.1 UNKNOWN [Stylonychia lemnae]